MPLDNVEMRQQQGLGVAGHLSPREENDWLRAKVDFLESILYGDQGRWEREFGLTNGEAVIFCALVRRSIATHESILSALDYRFGNDPEQKTVTVMVHRLRQKVGRKGITINTIRGTGYSLDERDRRRLLNSPSEAAA